MTNIITPQQLSSTLDAILADKEALSSLKHEQFTGMTHLDILSELNRRLGEDWVLKKAQPVQFTKDDINAVAASRFFKQTGMVLLMGGALAMLGLRMFTETFPLIPPLVYYVLNAVVAIAFIGLYSKGLVKTRKSLWSGIEGVEK